MEISRIFAEYRDEIFAAFWVTIKLTASSGLGALVLGTFLAAMRLSPVPMLRWLGSGYVTILRNTPLTLILLFCSFGLSQTLGVTLLPRAQVVILSAYADDESVFAAINAGASGYLTKDSGADQIRKAIETVQAGGALLDPLVQRRLLDLQKLYAARPDKGLKAPAEDDMVGMYNHTTFNLNPRAAVEAVPLVPAERRMALFDAAARADIELRPFFHSLSTLPPYQPYARPCPVNCLIRQCVTNRRRALPVATRRSSGPRGCTCRR